MKEQKIEPFYMVKAVDFIDTLYDKGYFREDVAINDMRGLDEYLAFLFQSYISSAIRCHDLSKKCKEQQ